MTNEQIEQATRLRERGDSIRDMADQLGLSESAVERALKDEAMPVGDLPS